MKIDLNTCKPGQKLKSRNGEGHIYVRFVPEYKFSKHIVEDLEGNQSSRRDNGNFLRWGISGRDIVAIL